MTALLEYLDLSQYFHIILACKGYEIHFRVQKNLDFQGSNINLVKFTNVQTLITVPLSNFMKERIHT